jgi:hypothetical protein
MPWLSVVSGLFGSRFVSNGNDLFGGSGELIAMTYLSEDPTFLAGGLMLLAGAFLLALKVTQQGKYAIRAAVALVLAGAVFLIEWVWVTDSERIEQVVYDLGQAVQRSDADRVLAHLMPTVQYKHGEIALSEDTTRAFIRSNLSNARFNFVRISDLQTSAGRQSRRGLADFRVLSSGSLNTSHGMMDARTNVTSWQLGFQETEPGVWKVNRITPVSMPYGALAMPGASPPPNGPPRRGVHRFSPKPRGPRLPNPPGASATN